VALGVGSHAVLGWYLAFQPVRFLDARNGVDSFAAFWGQGGGWGVVPYAPAVTCRIKTSAPATVTTSFALVELTSR